MALINSKEDKIFASVLADGRIHVSVPEGTEGAVRREYETSDKKVGVKWEFVYSELAGVISKVDFFDGDYGKSLQLTVEDQGEKPVVLSLSTTSNYGEDVMKKLLNIDMEKTVKFVPYSFTDDKGKNKKGVTVYQDEEKVKNYFFDEEKKKNIHGFPEAPKAKGKKPISKEEWKMYFMQAQIFLIDAITEHFKIGEETEEVKGVAKF